MLEEADIDAAIEPDAGAPDEAEEPTGFSLVSLDGRTSLGSTFLPCSPSRATSRRGCAARARATCRRSPPRRRAACGRAPGRSPWTGGRWWARSRVHALFIAAGHGPWGISTGPASAAHVAALVLGDADPREPGVRAGTDAARFGAPPVPASPVG